MIAAGHDDNKFWPRYFHDAVSELGPPATLVVSPVIGTRVRHTENTMMPEQFKVSELGSRHLQTWLRIHAGAKSKVYQQVFETKRFPA